MFVPVVDNGEDIEVYEEVTFSDLIQKTSDEGENYWYYDCPCGDIFTVTTALLLSGARIFECPTCSLRIRVIISAEQLDGMKMASE